LSRFGGLRRHEFWRSDDPAAERGAFKRIFLRFVPAALALIALTAWLLPDRLFNLPLQRPALWVGIATFYPLFSVYPQELLFRLFFFKRYAPHFAERRVAIGVNALVFGWAHVFFPTPVVAVGLCTLGGILFADTYARTRSLRLVWFEHALYGVLVFTIGMGEFFFSGRAR
jgi:membrane protease YdiL (CAAX protease family)